MKKLLAFASLSLLSIPAHADGTRSVAWEGLCNVSEYNALHVSTTAGDEFEGNCVSVDANEVSVRSNGKIVRIARDHVSRIAMISRPHQLKELGRDLQDDLRGSITSILSPNAPFALVEIPLALARSAIALPFCAIGDLTKPHGGPTELTILKPKKR